MKIALLGIVEDGSTRAPEVPLDSRRALRLPYGGYTTLVVKVVRACGVPYGLTSASLAAVLAVCPKQLGARPLVSIAGSVSRDTITFRVTPGNFSRLPVGVYSYDVWLADSVNGVKEQILGRAEFVVAATSATTAA